MRRLRHLLVPAIAIVLAGFTVAVLPARAQVIGQAAALTANASLSVATVPGIQQAGLFVTAPVMVDGASVFRVAALASPAPASLPIDTRVLLVQNAISQVLAVNGDRGTMYDPASFRVHLAKEGSQYALRAVDARHPDGIDIVTVTATDAQYAHLPDRTVAQQWQALLQPALVHALQKRQPEQIRRSLFEVARGAVILGIVTVALLFVWSLLGARARRLRRNLEDRADEHRRVVRALMTLIWSIAILWLAAITWALLLFPQTTAAGQFIIRTAGRVAAVWIGAFVIDRVLEIAIARFAVVYARGGFAGAERSRHMLRAPTIARALGGFKSWIIILVASLTTLGMLNIPVASVVTIGGIAALAIGFAAQSLVRDILNGMLVLLEDQYVVGDYVMIGDYNGIVEGLTLRMVQLRDGKGNLITIPHSSVSQVVNSSRTWSRVDYRVPVDPSANVTAGLQALRSTLDAFAADDAWRDAVLEPYEWVGVESMSSNGIVLRASVRTAPLRQFEVRRALNERVIAALREAKIELGLDVLGNPVPPVNASPDPV